MDNDKPSKLTYTGKIIKISSLKTVKVEVEFKYPHPKYGKIVKTNKKFLAHVEDASKYKLGEVVSITSCRKLSKMKSFKVV